MNGNRSHPLASTLHTRPGMAPRRDTAMGSRLVVDLLNTHAVMTVCNNGSPMRHVIKNGGKRITGVYTSVKTGRPVPWESFAERQEFHLHEVKSDVVGYFAQHHTLSYQFNGVLESYTPDNVVEYDNGTVEALEIKRNFFPDLEPELAEKYRRVEKIYAGIGWGFHIRRACSLEEDPIAFKNVFDIQRARNTLFDYFDEMAVRDCIVSAGGIARLDAVLTAIGGPRYCAEAKLFAMIVRRIVSIDLKQRVSPHSPVCINQVKQKTLAKINLWEMFND